MKVLAAFCLGFLVSLPAVADESRSFLIPEPVKMEAGDGGFSLTKDTRILYEKGADELKTVGEYLARMLERATGFRMSVMETDWEKKGVKQSIVLVLTKERPELGGEGYLLKVDPDSVFISARTKAGVFYGVQTVRQLLPPEIEGSERAARIIPCVTIEDYPRFSWRGFMIDCSRTFQRIEYLKRLIDLMALYKLNVFHLHLTDDQGWRIEIKKHPALTLKGSKFPLRYGGRGGFYTQEEMRDLIRYAAARNVTLVPEIEMPGHCLAALSVYPNLSCTGGPFDIYPFFKGPGIQRNVYCAGNDGTFAFLEEVLEEVIDLFPSPYIHLGGDEVPKAKWKACPKCQARIEAEKLEDEAELQSWFIGRMARFIEGKGRKVIGWDEIMEGGLAEGAAVMSWRGVKPGNEALQAGHSVVFSPTSHCYLDYTHKVTPLEKIYAFDPAGAGPATDEAGRILGVQANMWTHIAVKEKDVDSQVFPRLIALAEAAWSPPARRNEEDFLRRMKRHLPRLELLGVNVFDPGVRLGRWNPGQVLESYTPMEWTVTGMLDRPGILEVIFQYEGGAHRLGIEWVALIEDGREISRDTHYGMTGAKDENNVYQVRAGKIRKGARYLIRASVRSEGGTDSSGSLWLKFQK